jgi:hypothetical protein
MFGPNSGVVGGERSQCVDVVVRRVGLIRVECDGEVGFADGFQVCCDCFCALY